MKRILVVCAWLAGCLASGPIATAGEPIDSRQFDKLYTLIKPHKDERKWEQLPWIADLWEARRQAAKLGKPIVLWERDGHLLGCV